VRSLGRCSYKNAFSCRNSLALGYSRPQFSVIIRIDSQTILVITSSRELAHGLDVSGDRYLDHRILSVNTVHTSHHTNRHKAKTRTQTCPSGHPPVSATLPPNSSRPLHHLHPPSHLPVPLPPRAPLDRPNGGKSSPRHPPDEVEGRRLNRRKTTMGTTKGKTTMIRTRSIAFVKGHQARQRV
jgi:hypothetical protein